MEFIKNIAAVLGLISVIIALLTVGIPSLREKFNKWVHKSSGNDSTALEITEIKEMLEKHINADEEKQKDIDLQKEALKCILRDKITRLYYKHIDEGEINNYEFEDLIHLKDSYDSLHGNSYVQKIYDQITQEWKVVK